MIKDVIIHDNGRKYGDGRSSLHAFDFTLEIKALLSIFLALHHTGECGEIRFASFGRPLVINFDLSVGGLLRPAGR